MSVEPAQQRAFFRVQPLPVAVAALLERWQPRRRMEQLPTAAALGRILAEAPRAPADLPAFARSSMDGYAVRASDTFGASDALPAYLRRTGRVAMGEVATTAIARGECAEIATGAMLPPAADAVVMVEHTQSLGGAEIECLRAVAPGENVIQVGEDFARGAEVLPAGRHLRPQDIGALLALGILEVSVQKAPRVHILSGGDELVAPEETPGPAQIRDINSHTLAALITQAGGEARLFGIAPDAPAEYAARARAAFAGADILLLTAGSSVSARDLTRDVISGLGAPGILQHGLAIKPGKPTILALCDGAPALGLPGNPVSALLVARETLLPLIAHQLGTEVALPATQRARLSEGIASVMGRADTVPVRLERELDDGGGWLARPIFGKSNLIATLAGADGLLALDLDTSGLTAGSEVEIALLR